MKLYLKMKNPDFWSNSGLVQPTQFNPSWFKNPWNAFRSNILLNSQFSAYFISVSAPNTCQTDNVGPTAFITCLRCVQSVPWRFNLITLIKKYINSSY